MLLVLDGELEMVEGFFAVGLELGQVLELGLEGL